VFLTHTPKIGGGKNKRNFKLLQVVGGIAFLPEEIYHGVIMNKTTAIFVYEPDGDPYFNMACDNALFRLFTDRRIDTPAVLRLYSWATPAFTIGYNQKIAHAMEMSRVEEGTPVIRRITGGRAIYHDPSEITFSLIARMDLLRAETRSLSAINAAISETLVEILNSVGISAVWRRHSDDSYRGKAPVKSGACFASVSRYEIVNHEVKIVGGAQRRAAECFIHQGSIKINGVAVHPALGCVAEDFSGSAADDTKIQISDMKKSFIGNFGRRFNIAFDIDNYPPDVAEEIDFEIKKLRKNPLLKK
jgi:lipoate-protein ligase A